MKHNIPVIPIDSANRNDRYDMRRNRDVSKTGYSDIFVNLVNSAQRQPTTAPNKNDPKKTKKKWPTAPSAAINVNGCGLVSPSRGM